MSKNSFQIGYTIGGGQGEERKVRLAREQKEKKEQRHKIVFVALGAVGVLLLLAVIAKGFSSLQEMVTSKNEKEKIASIAPTVNIINENGQNDEISNRVKTFVARVEEGFSDNDLRVDHAVSENEEISRPKQLAGRICGYTCRGKGILQVVFCSTPCSDFVLSFFRRVVGNRITKMICLFSKNFL